MRYSPTLATFHTCVMCKIPQPRSHFPTERRRGQEIPRSACAPCRTAIDTFLIHVDYRHAEYECSVCDGIQRTPFIPNVCTECGTVFRRFKVPLRNGKEIPTPELRAMFHRNYHIAMMQRIVDEIGIEDTTAVFDRYQPEAILTCPCNTIAGPRADPDILRCSQTIDFWEIVAVLKNEL